MKILISLFFLQLAVFSQTKGTVVDQNNKPIPYVNIWVENENIGTTSEENGSFEINITDKNKNLVFSAVGFETKKVSVSLCEKIEMKRLIYELDEVVIAKPLKKKQITIGNFGIGKIRYYYGSGVRNPLILARYFPYNVKYEKLNFVKNIVFYSRSKIETAKVNVVLIEADKFGKPSNNLNNENIIVSVKKGERKTKVNLEDLNISVPENGFFVVVETLIIDENKFIEETVIEQNGRKTKYSSKSHQPSFGLLTSEKIETWEKTGLDWTPKSRKEKVNDYNAFSGILMRKYHNKYLEFPIELTLTN